MPRDSDVTDENAQRLDFADQQRGQEGSRDGTQAADDHHDKSAGDDLDIQAQRGGCAGRGQSATQAGQERAQHEGTGEQQRLVHAQGRQHAAILGSSAQQHAPARALLQQPQQAQHGGAGKYQEQVIGRETASQQYNGVAQAGRARGELVGRAPHSQRQVAQQQDEGKSGQQLEQFGRSINTAQHHDLQQPAEQADDHGSQW